MFQVYGLLSPKHSHEQIWSRTALLRSGLGNNIPLDILLEFFNRLLKEVQWKLGPNATNHKAIHRYCQVALENFDRECRVIRQSGKHYKISIASDLQKIAVEIISQRAFSWTPGRSYEQFKDMDSTLLEHLTDLTLSEDVSSASDSKDKVNGSLQLSCPHLQLLAQISQHWWPDTVEENSPGK